jgi:hypothetical protein
MHSPQKSIIKLSSDYVLATYFSERQRKMLNYFLRKERAIIREEYAKLLEKLIIRIRRKRPNL